MCNIIPYVNVNLEFLKDGNYGSLTGAIIGGALGGFVAIIVANLTLRRTADDFSKQEQIRDRKQRNQQKELMILALYTETKENLQLNEKGTIRSRKVRFADEAWAVHKSSIHMLPLKLQKLLIIAYNELKIYNSIIEYDIRNRSYASDPTYGALTTRPGAYNESELDDQAQHVRDAFKRVEVTLAPLVKSKTPKSK